MTQWKEMLDAVKEDCLVGLWSKGVDLARREAVFGDSRSDDEWVFRVRLREDEIAPTVSLFPDDAEWDCDCDGPRDPCEHVAAAVIFAVSAGEGLAGHFTGPGTNGYIRYEFVRTSVGLVLERAVVAGSDEPIRLKGALSDWLESSGHRFEPTAEDFDVDRLLTPPDQPIAFPRVARLLAALVGARDLRLDGETLRASAEPLFPRARVSDARQRRVELVIEADPRVSEVLAPGFLRAGDRLHSFGGGARFGQRWEKLPFRRMFAPADFGELVGKILPELERVLRVEVQTDRLPGASGAMPPWIQFEVDSGPEGLDVLPTLVYGEPPVARVEGGRLVALGREVPKRDAEEEKLLVMGLRDELNLVLGRRVRFEAADGARFLSSLRSFADGRPRASRGRGTIESLPDLTPFLGVPPGDAGAESDLLFRTGGASGSESVVGAEAVLSAWRQGLGMVPLSGGGFASIPTGWLERNGHLLGDLLAARAQNEGTTPTVALPILAELCEVLQTPPPFSIERLQPLLDSVPQESIVLPAGFRGSLRPYQASGVAWLVRLRDAGLGAVLADDMGLGKTVQALCAVAGRTLVACPRSVIHNWSKEIERFRPDLSSALYHGPGRAITDADVTLTTYATLRNDIDILADVEWDTVIIDEAQAIKNPDSQVARAVYRLRAGFRLSLSGTPIENRLDELWSQMHFTNRGLFGGRRDFADRYEKPMLDGDIAVAERLRTRLRPFLLRRRKKEVATDLPPRTEAVVYCELDDEERVIYDAVRLASRADVVKQVEQGASSLAVLEALLRMRQAACHPALLPGRQAGTSSKIEALCGALEDAVADGHKALVFSQWTGLLDLVEPHLRARSIEHVRLDGRTRDRAAAVETFQSETGPPVFLISLTAGGTGLNLTAADHVFLLDPWWNPAVEEQAADRAHRIGQDRPVLIYRLVTKDTVEERVLDLQARKRKLAEHALEGTGTAGLQISREEVLALLD